MSSTTRLRIGLIGDYSPTVVAHQAIPRALELASAATNCLARAEWLHTAVLDHCPDSHLAEFDGIWCTPASPYASMSGALRAIRYAREHAVPFLGTCGGFQHAVIEYARNVLGFSVADHAESSPNSSMPLVAPLTCSLVGTTGRINFVAGSKLAKFYGAPDADEAYHCNYGLNPHYLHLFQGSHFVVSAHDDDGEARAMELRDSDFFVGTLFQPERSAFTGKSHSLIVAFLRAAAAEKS